MQDSGQAQKQAQTKRKAKRKLTDFDFSSQDSHLALVGPAVGGPANSRTTLIFKSGKQFSEEFVKKMQQVKVTMELPDFLQKFFHVYYEDSLVLAKLMGYEEPENEVEEIDEDWYENYIQSKVDSFEIVKSLYEAKDIAEVVSGLSEDQYLSVLKSQESLEKIIKSAEGIILKQKNSNNESEENMTNKTSTPIKAEVEVVEKSVLEAIEKSAKEEKEALEKALNVEKEALQKALKQIQEFEEKEKEAIRKSKFAQLKNAVKDEQKAEVLFKAVGLVEDVEVFNQVVDILKQLTVAVDNTDLFAEKGASVEGEGAEIKKSESAVAKIIKAKKQ